MTTWGSLPWQNDDAIFWFGQNIANSELVARVEETLQLPLQGNEAKLRAAAAVLILLGRSFLWSGPKFGKHMRLAITRLEELEDSGAYAGSPEIAAELANEKAALQFRALQPQAHISGEVSGVKPFCRAAIQIVADHESP